MEMYRNLEHEFRVFALNKSRGTIFIEAGGAMGKNEDRFEARRR